jgi:hypothetical protein
MLRSVRTQGGFTVITQPNLVQEIESNLDVIFGKNATAKNEWLDSTFEQLADTPRNLIASGNPTNLFPVLRMLARVTG